MDRLDILLGQWREELPISQTDIGELIRLARATRDHLAGDERARRRIERALRTFELPKSRTGG